MKTLKILSFNAAILDIRIIGYSVYRPVDFIEQRLSELIRVLRKLDADVVFLQELFHRKYQSALCRALADIYPYTTGQTYLGPGLRLGNELITLSKLPLFKGALMRFTQAPTEELRHTSKGFYFNELDLGKQGTFQLINYHVSAGGKHSHPESTKMETIRAAQIQQILDNITANKKTLLVGDLNAGPDSSHDNYQQVVDAGFIDTFNEAGGQGVTWDPQNPLVEAGLESHLPAQRIDHIFIDQNLSSMCEVIHSQIVIDEKPLRTGLGATPLSDHYGVLTTIGL